jgi:tripartite-type tricarboxylate transporter receptor subunit TctC
MVDRRKFLTRTGSVLAMALLSSRGLASGRAKVSRMVAFALLAAMVLLGVHDVRAQRYPEKPIRIVVIFPAGGAADVLGRTVGDKLRQSWGQPVIVENRPGASGNIAAEAVAKSAPDGYTILLGGLTTHGINPSLYRRLPYDPVRDFVPITIAATTPLVLEVHPSVPAHSVDELISLARSRPGELNYASFGNGTSGHLATVLFSSLAGIDMMHVPYKGSPPAMADLLAGRVHLMIDAIPASLPHIKAGKLRALAVTSAERSRALPDVPTIAEAALPGFEVIGWLGFFAPAGVPAPIVQRLSAEIGSVLRMPDVRERLVAQGLDVETNTPGEFARFVDSELKKWAGVVKTAGVRVD